MGYAGLESLGQRLGIHMGYHEKRAVIRIGNDRRYEPIRIETWCEEFPFLQLGFIGGRWRKTEFLHRVSRCGDLGPW